MVVPKGSTKSPDYPRLVQLLKVAERVPLISPRNKTHIKIVLAFGSKGNTLTELYLLSGLLDTPETRLLHYAVFFNFQILPSVYYKESP